MTAQALLIANANGTLSDTLKKTSSGDLIKIATLMGKIYSQHKNSKSLFSLPCSEMYPVVIKSMIEELQKRKVM